MTNLLLLTTEASTETGIRHCALRERNSYFPPKVRACGCLPCIKLSLRISNKAAHFIVFAAFVGTYSVEISEDAYSDLPHYKIHV